MKTHLLSALAFIIFITFFSSCNEQENTVSTTAPTQTNSHDLNKPGDGKDQKDTITVKDSVINRAFWAAPGSLWPIEFWLFDHYEPVSGKILGIWPNHNTGPQEWIEYRTKWGFAQIFLVNTDYGAMAGYSKANCLIAIPNYATFQAAILGSDSCNYLIDEAIEQGRFNYNQLLEVSSFISQNRPNSKLHLTGYWCTPYLSPWYDYMDLINATNNTYLACDSYGGCGDLDGYGDQRTTGLIGEIVWA